MALVIGILSLGILGLRCFASLVSERQVGDPLVAYEMLRPGNSESALSNYRCDSAYLLASAKGARLLHYCNIHEDGSQILLITVFVRDGMIDRQELVVRGVRVGDLVMRWGRPDRIVRQGNLYSLYWDEGLYATALCENWFTYQAEVDTIGWSKPRVLSKT